MKPGDLVRAKNVYLSKNYTHWLYGGDDQCWNEFKILNPPTNISFGPSDIGLVLKKKKMIQGKYTDSYVKLLTSFGQQGWIFETYLETI